MDTIQTISQFAVSNSVLIFALGGLTLLSVVLLFTVVRQRKQLQVQQNQRRRYGFLGKPLYAAIVVALFVGGFGLTYFASRYTPEVTISADTKIDINIKTQILAALPGGTQVRLSMVPSVNSKEWGGTAELTVDAYWNISGPTSLSQIELNLNSGNQGGFVTVLQPGTYQISVDLIIAGRRFSKTITTQI